MQASAIFTADHKLYLICDGATCEAKGIALGDFMTGALDGGACYIQYRHKGITPEAYEKNLKWMHALCAETGGEVKLIVNDHAGLAEKYELPLHLGQGDLLPRGLKVPYGRSTHNRAELELALKASPPPDYIALGAMFPSPTKPGIRSAAHLISGFREICDLPLVLIGGITLDNVESLPRGERIFYAIISDVFRDGATTEAVRNYVREWS